MTKEPVTDQLQVLAAGQNGVPDRETIDRWRTRLKDLKKYDASLESAQARCIKVCEARSGQSDNARMGEVEWYTPPERLTARADDP